jgi:hypothetical protein
MKFKKMSKKLKCKIIDANKLCNDVDMNCDWDLSEFEAHKKEIRLPHLPSPSEIEKRAIKFLDDRLAEIK